jgi:hypothetical protein
MKASFIFQVGILFGLASPAIAVDFTDVLKGSVEGSGRNIMRTADGGIVAAFSKRVGSQVKLVFTRSTDNGRSWSNVSVDDVEGVAGQVAVDSNFQGSYIAFTEELNGKVVGRIAYFSAPFSDVAGHIVSDAITPEAVIPHDPYIQASRAGWGNLSTQSQETVVYGWQDAKSKTLYIGVSLDGHKFPMAKPVVEDSHAKSGPAVAIRGNSVIATYLTTNPKIVPEDVPSNGQAYPAWVESNDGGETWSKPAPLFGRTADDFPTVKIKIASSTYHESRLAGGTRLPNSPILNWNSHKRDGRAFLVDEDKTLAQDVSPSPSRVTLEELDQRLGGTTFVQTSMMALDVGGSNGEVSIVSFRPIEKDAKWTHVIANNMLVDEPKGIELSEVNAASKFKSLTSQFQYSALIDTPVRATIYKEHDKDTGTTRLIASVSTDTGKNFKQHLSFTEEQLTKLGIKSFDSTTVFAASQCLFENRNGDVFVDIILSHENEMHYARVPIGVNAAKLRLAE